MDTWFRNVVTSTAPALMGKGEADLSNVMRLLWEQHVAWTRMTIISIVFGLPDEKATIERLLRNPADLAEVFKTFYGRDIADKLRKLFTDHLVLAAQLVKAAKASDPKAADIEKRWYANADEIARFLASINPYWSYESWRTMMFEHLRLTKAEAVAMLSKDYAGSIDLFDKIELQALAMADMMSNGLILQFRFIGYQ